MISGNCPYCNQKYEIDETWIGKQGTCPNCNRDFTIPTPVHSSFSLDKFRTASSPTETARNSVGVKSFWTCNILLFLLLILIGALAFRVWFPSSPIRNDSMRNELFKHNIIKLLDTGEHITIMSSYGINKIQLESEVDQFEATLNMAIITWPDSAAEKRREFLNGTLECAQAVEGWRLTIKLWNLKVGEKDNPCAPDVNGFSTYQKYAGNKLVEEVHPDDCSVPEYRNKKYLPFDKNISVLLSISADHYQIGIAKIMKSIGAIEEKSVGNN